MFREDAKVAKMVEAAGAGDLDTVKDMTKKGVPVDRTSSDDDSRWYGWRAISAAAENGHYSVVRYLAEDCNSRRITDAASRAALGDHKNIVDLLIGCGAEATYILTTMAHSLKVEMAEYLIDAHGAEVTEEAVHRARNFKGATEIAVFLGNKIDPEGTTVWLREQNIRENGTDEERAALDKDKKLKPLFNILAEVVEGLDVLKASPVLNFDYSVTVDDEEEVGLVETNLEGEGGPVSLTVHMGHDDGWGNRDAYIEERTGNATTEQTEQGWTRRKEEVLSFNSVAEAVDDVMKRAIQSPGKSKAVPPQEVPAAPAVAAPAEEPAVKAFDPDAPMARHKDRNDPAYKLSHFFR